MNGDEQTLAQEVAEVFSTLAKEPNRPMWQAFSVLAEAKSGTVEYFTALARVKKKCDQLFDDIQASSLRPGSKGVYGGAVNTLAEYISLSGLTSSQNHQLRAERQAFEYLVLVDDYLEPLDRRDLMDDLEDILELAELLLKDLNAASIDPRLKAFLEKQVKQFIWTVHSYEYAGVEGLSEAWGAMAAEISRSSKGFSGSQQPEAQAWYKKALPILGAIGLAVTSVNGTVEQVDNLITHGDHIVTVVTGADPKVAEDPKSDKAEGGPETH